MSHPFAGKRVAVVMGGLSAEREVSLNTGAGVIAALTANRWDAVAIDWAEGTSLAQLLERTGAQVVWNALHGTWERTARCKACVRASASRAPAPASSRARSRWTR